MHCVCSLTGLAFVACYAVSQLHLSPLAEHAAAAPHIEWVQTPRSLLLYVGTTCFTFEGGQQKYVKLA